MQSLINIQIAIANRDLTGREAIARCFDRIKLDESKILAFEALAPEDEALSHAATAEGPLAGIAIGIKDIFNTYDMPTGYGSPIYAHHQPAADAAIVASLRQAGATIIGKTVTTEFAFFHPGKTRNPHNPAHTPGGSSSGSAAAIAAGMIPAAIGSQTGGSVIRPAAFCGIAGYKPGFGLVSATGMKHFSRSLDTVGFFAASVADVARLASLATGRLLDGAIENTRPPRIGLFRGANWLEASTDMRDAIEQTAGLCSNAGAILCEIEEPEELTLAREIHSNIQGFEAAQDLADELIRFPQMLSDKLRSTLEQGRQIELGEYDTARSIARRGRRKTRDLFDNIDVLLTPSAPGAAPAGLETTGNPLFNKLWTLTGNPCVSVPGLHDAASLPLGIQIVARYGSDDTALAAANWVENVIRRG